jgi:hypothetical protein
VAQRFVYAIVRVDLVDLVDSVELADEASAFCGGADAGGFRERRAERRFADVCE